MSHNIMRFNFLLVNGIVSWANKKAVFSIKAKYMAISFAIVKAICLRRLLHKLGFCLGHHNQGIIGLMKNITHHRKPKHVDIRYHYFKETMNVDEVVFHPTMTNSN